MIFRSALIGFALATVVLLVLFLPKGVNEGGDLGLPPRLFPMFERTEQTSSPSFQKLVRIEKDPRTAEIMPGGTAAFTITVENTGEHALRNLIVEERFDSQELTVLDAGGGGIAENRLAWTIPVLNPSAPWSVRYVFRVGEKAAPVPLQTTAYVYGEDLRTMTSGARMVSSTLSIIPLPETGAELGPVLRFVGWLLR